MHCVILNWDIGVNTMLGQCVFCALKIKSENLGTFVIKKN